MRALFKQENPNVLIIRDADWNEASLLIRYLDNIENGASLEAKAAYNGNQEVNGIVFTVKTEQEQPIIKKYINIKAIVTNDVENLPVFRIRLLPEEVNFTSFKLDESKWAELKEVLDVLGVTDLSITSQGDIVGANTSGSVITGTIVVPKGLLQFLDSSEGTVDNYNSSLAVTLYKAPVVGPEPGKPGTDGTGTDGTETDGTKTDGTGTDGTETDGTGLEEGTGSENVTK